MRPLGGPSAAVKGFFPPSPQRGAKLQGGTFAVARIEVQGLRACPAYNPHLLLNLANRLDNVRLHGWLCPRVHARAQLPGSLMNSCKPCAWQSTSAEGPQLKPT